MDDCAYWLRVVLGCVGSCLPYRSVHKVPVTFLHHRIKAVCSIPEGHMDLMAPLFHFLEISETFGIRMMRCRELLGSFTVLGGLGSDGYAFFVTLRLFLLGQHPPAARLLGSCSARHPGGQQ